MAAFRLDSRIGSVRPLKTALVLGSVDGAFLLVGSGTGTHEHPGDGRVREAIPGHPRIADRGSDSLQKRPQGGKQTKRNLDHP